MPPVLRKNVIIIRTPEDVNKLETGLSRIQTQYLGFVVYELVNILNVEVIDKIQRKMESKKISRKIIERTYLDTRAEEQGRTITFTVLSDYVSDTGFPVARIIEYGRKAYLVRPKQNRPNATLSYIKNGIRIFSKKSDIPEKKASNIITDTIRQATPRIQKELNKRTIKWISQNLKE